MKSVELLVTDVKELSARRKLVYVNFEPFFALYTSELKRYGIKKDSVLSEEVYDSLLKEVFYKRATVRAMSLLKNKDYTEKELYDKLKAAYYPQEALTYAVEYVRQYGYMNDYRYAENYVHFKSASKSRKQIEMRLFQKGIAKNIVASVMETYYEEHIDDELQLVMSQMAKKLKGKTELSYEERGKVMATFYRKGFQSDTIQKAMEKLCDKSEEFD